MTVAYNPSLLGKMLDLAGHPSTPDREALIALRKANDHCSSRGHSLGDTVQFVNGDIFVEARHMRSAVLLNEIADLRVALDSAELRVAAQAETIVDLRRARNDDASTIIALQAKIVALNEKLDSQTSAVTSIEPVLAAVNCEGLPVDGPAIEMSPAPVLSESAVAVVELDDAISCCEAEPVSATPWPDTSRVHEAETAVAFTRFEHARLILLGSLGHARSAIARILSREFGRRVAVASVAEVLRQRWLSPRYRSLVDALAATRRKVAARNRAALSRNSMAGWSQCA